MRGLQVIDIILFFHDASSLTLTNENPGLFRISTKTTDVSFCQLKDKSILNGMGCIAIYFW